MSAVRKTEPVVRFPTKEIKVVSFVNCPNILMREELAREYSHICTMRRKAKANHEDIMYLLSGLSLFAGLVALYFIGIIL